MDRMKKKRGSRDWNRWYELRQQLDDAYTDEEAYWSQKARKQWLQEGDKNTQFFHATAAQRRKRNGIETLEREDGSWCANEGEVVDEISDYYSNLFTSVDAYDWKDRLNGIPATITESMNSSLIKPEEDEEIKEVVFSMNPSKAPGIDGMTPLFFQTFWHLIHKDVCKAAKSFFYQLFC